MDASDIEDFIASRLPAASCAFVPEINLHLAVPTSGLRLLADFAEVEIGAPYWAYPWAGGLALARYLLDHPDVVAGKSVFDLGCGSGLVAIAAAMAGAARVVAADVDRHAAAATGINARANRVAIEVICCDPTGLPPPDADLILVGDVFYDPPVAASVTGFLDRCAAAGVPALVGDPWRASLPLPRLRAIAHYQIAERPGGEARRASVFAFVPTPGAVGPA